MWQTDDNTWSGTYTEVFYFTIFLFIHRSFSVLSSLVHRLVRWNTSGTVAYLIITNLILHYVGKLLYIPMMYRYIKCIATEQKLNDDGMTEGLHKLRLYAHGHFMVKITIVNVQQMITNSNMPTDWLWVYGQQQFSLIFEWFVAHDSSSVFVSNKIDAVHKHGREIFEKLY